MVNNQKRFDGLKIASALLLIMILLLSSSVFSSRAFTNISKTQPPRPSSSPNISFCKTEPPQEFSPIRLNSNHSKMITANLTNITQQIRKNLQDYEKHPSNVTKLKLQSLLNDRKRNLVQAIRENPSVGITFILSPDELSTLRNISNNCVENLVNLTGQVQVEIIDFFKQNFSSQRYTLITNDSKHINLHAAARLNVPLRSGSEVFVAGYLIDNDLVFVNSSPFNNLESTTGLKVLRQPISPAITGGQSIAVLLLNFNNTPPPNVTPAQIRYTLTKSVNNYYIDSSYGNLFFSRVDVFGIYNLPIPNNCGNNDDDINAAIKASDPDVFFPNYNRLILVAPYIGCGWLGLSNYGPVGASRMTADGAVSLTVARILSPDAGTIGHELGHSFGASHASSLDCGGNMITTNSPIYYDCDYNEYGDPYDIMGFGSPGHINTPQMDSFGWFKSTNIMTINPSDCIRPCRFTLEPIETATNNLKALKIARGDGDFLYVEYRQPIGNDSIFRFSTDVFNGATLHITGDRGASYPYLLDSTPDGIDDGEFNHSVLPVGHSVSDPFSKMVKVISANPNGLTEV